MLFISHIHSYAIYQIIAMCLNYKCLLLACERAKKRSKLSLTTRMQMNLGLLQ